jgi:hypothetical protein
MSIFNNEFIDDSCQKNHDKNKEYTIFKQFTIQHDEI